MTRLLRLLLTGGLLTIAQSSFAIPGSLEGPVVWFAGHYYGAYDQWQVDFESPGGERIDIYRSGIAFGPLGSVNWRTTRPWVRILTPYSLGIFGALTAAFLALCFHKQASIKSAAKRDGVPKSKQSPASRALS